MAAIPHTTHKKTRTFSFPFAELSPFVVAGSPEVKNLMIADWLRHI